MENLIIKPNGTPEGTEAMNVYFGIENAKAQAANAMVELCRNLKTMRDKKLYIHLGFEKFEEYVEKAHGIRQRQAYTYIKTFENLSPKLLADNADIGITKLSLLCQVSAIDREDFVQENDLANITVAEMEKLIEEKNGLHEQVSLLEAAVAAERSRAEAEMDKKIKEAVKDEQKKAKAKLDKQREDFEKQQKTAAEGIVADAVAKAKAEWQAEQQKQQSELEAAVTEAKNQAAVLEKQLAIKGDDKLTRFSIFFEQIQTDLMNCITLVNEIATEDTEKAEQYKGMLRKACEMALGG